MSKTTWMILGAGAALWLLSKRRSGLRGLGSASEAQRLCEQARGRFRLGSSWRKSRCYKHGKRAPVGHGYGDQILIPPSTFVHDPALPDPINGQCSDGFEFRTLSDGRQACLRRCPKGSFVDLNGGDPYRYIRDKHGFCRRVIQSQFDVPGGGGGD